VGITRCGNVYGGGDYHWDRLVPGIIRSYIYKEIPQIRSNGQYYRDYVYIDDIIDGYIKFGEFKYYSSNQLDIVNLGTGSPSRVLDVTSVIAEQFYQAPIPEILYRADREIHRQYVGSDLAMKMFGWKPTVKLRDGIIETVGWYKKFFNEKGDFNG
jgi:CDP-glucose 4,6-dehydratase